MCGSTSFARASAPRARIWIELVGGLTLLLPFLAVLVYFAWYFLTSAWANNEGSPVVIGLQHRWFIKSFVFIGFLLLLAISISLVLRFAIYLFGPADLRSRTRLQSFTGEFQAAPEKRDTMV